MTAREFPTGKPEFPSNKSLLDSYEVVSPLYLTHKLEVQREGENPVKDWGGNVTGFLKSQFSIKQVRQVSTSQVCSHFP